MDASSEHRLKAVEDKQTEHQIAMERIAYVVEDMRQSVDEIKGYMKSAVTAIVGTALTILVGGVATLLWYGLKAALSAGHG